MDINFNGKLGVLFAPKTTFLVIFPAFSMLNLKKHQIWVPWVITKILMCHMPGFEAKKFLYFFSIGVFYTLVRGCNKEIQSARFSLQQDVSHVFSMKSLSNWTPSENFGICSSGGFHNTLYILNLTKIWLSYLWFKTFDTI